MPTTEPRTVRWGFQASYDVHLSLDATTHYNILGGQCSDQVPGRFRIQSTTRGHAEALRPVDEASSRRCVPVDDVACCVFQLRDDNTFRRTLLLDLPDECNRVVRTLVQERLLRNLVVWQCGRPDIRPDRDNSFPQRSLEGRGLHVSHWELRESHLDHMFRADIVSVPKVLA